MIPFPGRPPRCRRRPGPRVGLLVLIATAGTWTAAAGAQSPPPTSRSEGHARMVALLAELARTTPHGYPVRADVETQRAAVASLSPEAPLQQQVRTRFELAGTELTLGNTERSIELYEAVLERAPRLPEDRRLPVMVMTTFWLGVANLRLGETRNCVMDHSGEACIMPLRGRAIHADKRASRNAVRYLEQIVRAAPPGDPLQIASKWLLNIAYMTLGEYPDGVPADLRIDPSVFASDEEFPRFPNVAPRVGLATVDLAGGAVVDDFDGDGLLDVATSTLDTGGQLRLFRNRGDGGFEEVTDQAGLTGLFGGLNLVQADYDDDGDLDLLVLRGAWLGAEGRHPNSLIRNDGDMTFTDRTFESGLGDVHYPTQAAAWADYDGDGDLDLYVGNESGGGLRFPSQLFRNDGDGTFTDAAREAGVENLRWSKGVSWGDYDADGFPDLYVSNLHGENRLYHNDRDGTFTDVAPELGITGPRSSFPVWFWDFDNDGALDLMVNSYQMPLGPRPPDVWYVAASHLGLPHPADLPALYRGDGRGSFVDVAAELNLKRATLPMGANFGDVDGDGYLDFYLGTGYPGYEGLMPNVMYRSDAGHRFVDVTYAGGFGHLQKGHGIAFADIDNDGDHDVFEQMGGLYPGDAFADALYENPGFGHHWITIELAGVRSNRFGVGARIRVEVVEGEVRRSIYRHVGSGGSFGANPLRQEIGLGDADRIATLEVDWPASGATQTFRDVAVDQFVRITEDEDRLESLVRPSLKLR